MVEVEWASTHVSCLANRVRQHERLMALAGVPLDRAAVALLRAVADSDALRPSELAGRLGVEASHITRQVQQLQKAGYVTRVGRPHRGPRPHRGGGNRLRAGAVRGPVVQP
ncbi:MarR family transcriptional regulator [Streptomyces corynorhini]|uniref:MarR family transcriptional regulator n=1 Tax=Streptomyces corynorhini TaxID=2282652 RepID=A0A370B6R5_9ACTN|nr:MarR family transcriptional regulator [Streptomyces corynorhini]